MHAAASIDASATGLGTGIRLASGAPPVGAVMNPPASTMRSNVERSTIRSLMIGNAPARHGSITIVSLLLNERMCNWQVVVARCGPCAWPLIINEQVPQMPSRQSWSNTTASSPLAMRRSLSTSSISKNEASSVIDSMTCVSKCPASFGPAWRHTLSVRFVSLRLTCSSVLPVGSFRTPALLGASATWRHRRSTPRPIRGSNSRRRVVPHPHRSDTRRGSGRHNSLRA